MSQDAFLSISHRGFGKRAYPRYQKDKKLQYVSNSLTAIEIAIELGANALELDLSKTSGGHIVTAHGVPFRKDLGLSLSKYLEKNPESLTLTELFDWLVHQDKRITLYLELKSDISIKDIFQNISSEHDLIYEQVMLYSHKLPLVKKLLKEKEALGLDTNQLKIWCAALPLITRQIVDKFARLGTDTNRIFGIEQGMLPWGIPWFTHLPKVKKYFLSISEIAKYTHDHNLQFIIGTIDNPKWVIYFREHNVDGVVPNSPVVFQGQPAKDILSREHPLHYTPLSLKQRLF